MSGLGPNVAWTYQTPLSIDTGMATDKHEVTDADPVLGIDPVRRPGVANLAVLLGALTGVAPGAALAGLHGSSALKTAVTEAIVETVTPIQRAYADLMADPASEPPPPHY